jgi:hypothetical protein
MSPHPQWQDRLSPTEITGRAAWLRTERSSTPRRLGRCPRSPSTIPDRGRWSPHMAAQPMDHTKVALTPGEIVDHMNA